MALERLRVRALGHEVAFRVGGATVRLTPVKVVARSGGTGRRVGRFSHLDLAAEDVEWPGRRLDRLDLSCADAAIAQGRGLQVSAASVDVTAVLGRDGLRQWAAVRFPWLALDLDDGAVRLAHAHRFRRVHLLAEPRADGCAHVRLRLRALVVHDRRMSLGGVLVLRRRLPTIPGNLCLTSLEIADAKLTARGHLTDWRWSLSQDDLVALMRGSDRRNRRG
jgi:hypothetical protein